MLDTRGLDNVVKELVRTMEEGALKEAFKKVLAETNEAIAQVYYDRLAACWSVTGRIDNISPDYLLTGAIKTI